MSNFLPCFLALLVVLTGNTIFHYPPNTTGNGPLASCYIFLIAIFFFLWEQRVYPKSLRKNFLIIQYILEFIIVEFIMELLCFDFWFPFERSLIGFFPKLADEIENFTKDKEVETRAMPLREEYVGVMASYFFSTFFLIAVLHGTRVMDLRLIGIEGASAFFKDISYRFLRFLRQNFPEEFQDWACNCKMSLPAPFISTPSYPPAVKPENFKALGDYENPARRTNNIHPKREYSYSRQTTKCK